MAVNHLPKGATQVFSQSLSPGVDFSVTIDEKLKPQAIGVRRRDETAQELLEAVQSKLVRDPQIDERRNQETGEFDFKNIDRGLLENTIADTTLAIAEAKNLVDALPDLGLVQDIIISSVLSPNDMMSTELTYSVMSDLFGDVAPEMIEIIKDYFDNEYDIGEQLTDWLRKSLFIEGAVPLVVIPESSIDHAINSNLKITQESIGRLITKDKIKNYGLLTTPRYRSPKATTQPRLGYGFGVEDFKVSTESNYDPVVGTGKGLGITVIDNPELLKLPKIHDKLRRDKLSEIYGRNQFGIESIRSDILNGGKKINSSGELYPNRTGNNLAVMNIKTLDELDKKTVGHPTVFQLPMECVIPVYSPSEPDNHICYFIALDEHGNPLRSDQQSDQARDMQQSFSRSQTSGSNGSLSTLTQTAKQMGIKDSNNLNKSSFEENLKLYSRVVEQDLLDRLSGGGFHGKDLKTGKATELYKLMFIRTLEHLNTQLLFVPADLLTYIAFEYKPNGVGRSLLDKTKVIASLRMVDMIATAIANAKSAVDHRKLNIKLDPEDPDPVRRVEQYLHEFQRATKASFPMGSNSFVDITDYLQKAGVQVEISGHEGMPDMNMEMTNLRYDYTKPDDSYAEELGKRHIMSLGAPPESIRSTEDIQFATSVISSNIYFAKISLWRQKIFCKHLSDHMQKFTLNSQPLMDRLIAILKANRDKLTNIPDKYSDEARAIVFAQNIKVELPKPDVAQAQMQLEAFEKYEQLVEKAMPYFLGEDIVDASELGEKAGEAIGRVVNVVRAHYMRRWLEHNNVLPELFDLINRTPEASDIFDYLRNHEKFSDILNPIIIDMIITNLKRAKKSDSIVEKTEEILDTEATGYDSSGGGDTGGGDDFGGDDMGMDDDFGGEDDFDMGGEGEEGDDELGDFGDF